MHYPSIELVRTSSKAISPAQRCALYAIACHMTKDGGEAIMSHDTFARECSIHKKTAQKVLKELEALGEISIIRGGRLNGRNYPSRISIIIKPINRGERETPLIKDIIYTKNNTGSVGLPPNNDHPTDIIEMAKDLGITPISGPSTNYGVIRSLWLPPYDNQQHNPPPRST